jgi:OmpA-OmpF porin, OOP family
MKKLFSFLVVSILCTLIANSSHAQLSKLKQKVKDKVNQRVDQKEDKAIDNVLDSVDNATKSDQNKTAKSKGGSVEKDINNKAKNTDNQTADNSSTNNQPSIKAYQNYDFIPGDKILFEDHFTDDQDAEFPSHWELLNGQGQLNKIGGEEAVFLTEGNYAKVKPRMKTDKYLTDPFTVEFDYYNKDDAYGLITFLGRINAECDCESTADVQVSPSEVSYGGAVNLSKSLPADLQGDNFINKWHHVAIAVKNHQLKIYVDQNRVLVVPDTKNDFFNVSFGGIGDEEKPLIFKNVRVASGGNMNMIGKKFTESKIVTHGINFDIDKATIKPESMGTLNMIVQVLKDNPDLKFEIDGHTDNSGTAQHNLTLSQQRADAVKAQLVSMDIDASRLTTKGFGDTKPISDNTSLEGKANNRRVEFVKK